MNKKTKWIIGILVPTSVIGIVTGITIGLLNTKGNDEITLTIKRKDLDKIYNSILDTYGVNSETPFTMAEFAEIVNTGSLKSWIINLYGDYFVSSIKDSSIDFNLSFKDNILTFSDKGRYKLKIYNYSFSRATIFTNDNGINLKFNDSDFVWEKKWDYDMLNEIRNNCISDLQFQRRTFDDIINLLNDVRKSEYINWFNKLFGGDFFDDLSFSTNSIYYDIQYSVTLKIKSDYRFTWKNNLENNSYYEILSSLNVKGINDSGVQDSNGSNDNGIVDNVNSSNDNNQYFRLNFSKIINIKDENIVEIIEKAQEYIITNKIQRSYLDIDNSSYNFFSESIILNTYSFFISELSSSTDIFISIENINNLKSISIKLKNGYNFLSNSEYLVGNKIDLSSLEYFWKIEFSNESLKQYFDYVQNFIIKNQFTKDEFQNWFNSNDVKKELLTNLLDKSGEVVKEKYINSIIFDFNTNEIKISPSLISEFNFSDALNESENWKLDENGNIIISNLIYFDSILINNTNLLFDAIQNKINTNKYTINEFKEYIESNLIEFKTLIINNLKSSSGYQFSINDIDEISFDESNNLELTLNSNYLKYTIEDNKNCILNGNMLTINNLVYYDSIKISSLSDVFDYVQDIVKRNSFTPNEFKTWLNTNSAEFKTDVASKMKISENQSINRTLIEEIILNSSNQLQINLVSNNKKYTIGTYANASIKNSTIYINNIAFYTSVNFYNLNNVFNALQNFISTNMFSSDGFKDYVTKNNTTIKNMIISNWAVSASGPDNWSDNQIYSIEYYSGDIRIKLNPSQNFKYSITATNEVTFFENTIIISGFNYYQRTPPHLL